MKRTHWQALVALLTGSACAPTTFQQAAPETRGRPSQEVDPHLASRVDAVLEQAIAERRIVGAVVLVLRDGRLIYHRAAGLADRETSRPMSEDTIFRYASMSKPIVSAAALALIDRGRIGLDDPVTRWLPEFRPRTAAGEAPPITVRELLTHTSGLGYRFLEPDGGPYHQADVSDGLDQPGLSFEENARRVLSAPLLAPPGTQLHYSLSTDVLGQVVGKAAGSSLPEAVSELVTGPLGMSDTGFAVADVHRLAAAYADGSPEPVLMRDGQLVPLFAGAVRFAPSRAFDPRSYASGGAGMVGTARDFVTFLEALRTHVPVFLHPQAATAAMSNQVGALRASEVGDGWGFGFVGAVLVDPGAARSPMSVGTVRWGGAYGHTWFVDPKEKLTVVLMTNTAFEGMAGRLPIELTDAIYARGSADGAKSDR
jgi:CubicO group peptidase (beta-lactamase class C family)